MIQGFIIASASIPPLFALLALVWPKGRAPEQLGDFSRALGADLARWGAHLVGGDTTSTDGPLTLSLTLLGRVGERGLVGEELGEGGDDGGGIEPGLADSALRDRGLELVVGLAQIAHRFVAGRVVVHGRRLRDARCRTAELDAGATTEGEGQGQRRGEPAGTGLRRKGMHREDSGDRKSVV